MLPQVTDGRLIGLPVEQNEVGVAEIEGLLLGDRPRFGDSIASLVIRSKQQVEVPVHDLHGVTGVISSVEADGGVRGECGECVLCPVEGDDQPSVQIISVHEFDCIYGIFVPRDSESPLRNHDSSQHAGDECRQFHLEQDGGSAVKRGGLGVACGGETLPCGQQMCGHPETKGDGEERQVSDMSERLSGDDQQQCRFQWIPTAV